MKSGFDVAVTGATGFLGWHLAEAFRDAGWRVRAIVRPGNRKVLPVRIRAIEAPLEAGALAAAAKGANVLVHAAGLTHARDERVFRAINVGGTEVAVAAANAAGAQLLLISSQAAVGTGTLQRPSREADPPRPVNAYGRSKLAAEAVVMASARRPWIILRPSAVYGPRDCQFLPLFRLAARGWFPVAADPAMPLTLTYVEDVVNGVIAAARLLAERGRGSGRTSEPGQAKGEVLFIGHPQPQSVNELLRSLADVYQRPYRPRRVPAAVLAYLSFAGGVMWKFGREPLLDAERLAELRAEGFVCSVERARDALGFRAAVGLADGVERTARWYREQGWVSR